QRPPSPTVCPQPPHPQPEKFLVNALERIAGDSPEDQRTVREVLSAFAREHARPPAAPGPDRQSDVLATDVQAALAVLGRLDSTDDWVSRADLTGADLHGARLDGADLSGARLLGTNLSDALLTDAILYGASMVNANLAGAALTGATLTIAVLDGADLTGARLSGANLDGASLCRAALRGARLSGTSLGRTDLSGADLSEAHGLKSKQLERARGDGETKLPGWMPRPSSWPPRSERDD
ncbi:pentapeptide repeat-containing protein, partial [Frankia sp. Cpl3]|nr:pentapeptide repeat-containing protein [Frankia sp. Cpl3]